MKKVAIIGAGVSGLYLANLLEKEKDFEYKIFEKRTKLNLEEGYGIQLSVNSIKLLNKLNFNNLTELRLELCNENKIFKELNVLPNINSLDFGNKKLILKRSFEYNIKNFYMNDIISRSSINMANCSKEILNQVE